MLEFQGLADVVDLDCCQQEICFCLISLIQ